MKSKNWFFKSAGKMFPNYSFYTFILLCFCGLLIYLGCIFDRSGLKGGGVAISITPPPDGCVNQYYYYDLNSYYGIYGFDPSTQYQMTSGSYPPGLSLDTNSGILSGTPTVTGTFTFEIDVVDAASVVLASGSFTININDFSIVTSFLPPICAGTNYSAIIDICGGIPPFTWETIDWDPSALPLNFTVPGPDNSRQNTLTGTPATAGDYTFKIRVTDSRGTPFRIEKEFTIEVTDQLTILTPRHLPSWVVNVPNSHTLEACGGTTPYTWDQIDSTSTPWPVFLSLNQSTGTLSGTPAAADAGAHFLAVKLTENGGSNTWKYFSLTVAASPLTISNMNVVCTECTSCIHDLSGMLSGGLGVPYWQLVPGETLPPGLSLSSDGILSGIATTPGTFNFNVNVYDGTTDPLNPPQGVVTVNVPLNPADSEVVIEWARQWSANPVDPNYHPPNTINLADNTAVKFDFHFLIPGGNWENTWLGLAPTPSNPVERRQVTLSVVGLCNVEISSIDIRYMNTDDDPDIEHVAVFALSDPLVQDFVQLVAAAGGVGNSPFIFRIQLNVPEAMTTQAVDRIENIVVVNEP